MKITIIPQVGLPGQPETKIAVSGDTMTVDGIAYDLSAVPEGGQAAPEGEEHPFCGSITRSGGDIHATIRVALGEDAADHQPTDPAHWVVEVSDGTVTIPAIRRETAEQEGGDE